MAAFPPSQNDIIDIAIIGGGVSGMYADTGCSGRPGRSPVLSRMLQQAAGVRSMCKSTNGRPCRRAGCGRSISGAADVPAEWRDALPESMQNVYGLCTQKLGLDVASFDFANTFSSSRPSLQFRDFQSVQGSVLPR